MSAHAQLSPSGAVRWMACPGSVALCQDLPERSSAFADEGTDAHELAALCLQTHSDAIDYADRLMGKGFRVGREMVQAVQAYLDYVRAVVHATQGQLLVEQRLPISAFTGEDGAHGTSDVVILTRDELIVVDLKYGRGVPVQAQDNPQLQLYALGAFQAFALVGEFAQVRMVIHQPRLGRVSEWCQSTDELLAFATEVQHAAARTRTAQAALQPSNQGCRFCRAKAICPALGAQALEAFEAVVPPDASASHLAQAMALADRIDDWIKAVRAEVELRLLSGHPVPGWKLVAGKRANRAWHSKDEAQAVLKSMGLTEAQMYDFNLISPTTADRLAQAGTLGPRQWRKVQTLITQAPGRPSVAALNDERPALTITPALCDFDVLP